MKKYSKLFLSILILATGVSAEAQHVRDTTWRRNIIKLDLTSHLLYRNAMVLSYERVVKDNQSWSISGGLIELPPLRSLTSAKVIKNTGASGFKMSGDYRFYLKRENKYRAPRGAYVGPYFTVLNFRNERNLEVDNNGLKEYAQLSSTIGVVNIGFQLGYQFIINNRWTLDMVFVGPSVSNYRAKLTLDGSYTFDPADVQNEVIEGLIGRFPALGDLLTDHEITSSGKINTWAWGYRYQFMVGYHFGRKKK